MPLLVIIIIAGSVINRDYRFDLRLNSINRYILKNISGSWGVPIPMIPKPFPAGISKAEVEKRLAKAGFERAVDRVLNWPQVQENFGTKIDEGAIIYVREANRIVCNQGLYIFVSFDEKDRLTYGESAIYEHGCL